MNGAERILALACVAWAVLLLFVQFILARGHARDYSAKSGSPIKGMLYNFTFAMLPSHKETVRLHAVKFLIGVFMHLGVFVGFAITFALLIRPELGPIYPYATLPVLGLSALCGIYLLVRRIVTPTLRAMSCFDDYFSIFISVAYILAAALHELSALSTPLYFMISAFLFFYLPIGKLRHALFFFLARASYGRRLGYRGVYPSTSGGKE